jgi:hypothetical protein
MVKGGKKRDDITPTRNIVRISNHVKKILPKIWFCNISKTLWDVKKQPHL